MDRVQILLSYNSGIFLKLQNDQVLKTTIIQVIMSNVYSKIYIIIIYNFHRSKPFNLVSHITLKSDSPNRHQ